jgi:hypothetical protein
VLGKRTHKSATRYTGLEAFNGGSFLNQGIQKPREAGCSIALGLPLPVHTDGLRKKEMPQPAYASRSIVENYPYAGTEVGFQNLFAPLADDELPGRHGAPGIAVSSSHSGFLSFFKAIIRFFYTLA